MDTGELILKFFSCIPWAVVWMVLVFIRFYITRTYQTGISYWIGGGYLIDSKRSLKFKVLICSANVLIFALLLTFTGSY